MYFDDDDDGNYGDGDDGALTPDQDLILVCTNKYFNLPSECRSIHSSPCWKGAVLNIHMTNFAGGHIFVLF